MVNLTHAVIVPGHSSRSQLSTFRQFPQRDEAAMHDSDLHQPGFSNSEPVEDAPQDVHPDIPEPEPTEPGFSNSKAVKSDDDSSDEPTDEDDDETANKSAAAKKTTTKKG